MRAVSAELLGRMLARPFVPLLERDLADDLMADVAAGQRRCGPGNTRRDQETTRDRSLHRIGSTGASDGVIPASLAALADSSKVTGRSITA